MKNRKWSIHEQMSSPKVDNDNRLWREHRFVNQAIFKGRFSNRVLIKKKYNASRGNFNWILFLFWIFHNLLFNTIIQWKMIKISHFDITIAQITQSMYWHVMRSKCFSFFNRKKTANDSYFSIEFCQIVNSKSSIFYAS